MLEFPVLNDNKEDDEFHETLEDGVDMLEDEAVILDKPKIPTTMSFSVKEMDVITNRGGRTNSLSKFLDDASTYLPRSLNSYPEKNLFLNTMNKKEMDIADIFGYED
ncbi:hypothetical protein PsorP6_015622 [Peronosclerospora sorghi]|uniref:Uncharacterized protein n=1 Tax=Peronosclerospora sorghi TaxID=230839 RepID=A0ACC0WP60_9STRA|nr:hypothetical protein PsorP6_015622 [Peronosclerospora sorghi]